MIKNIRIIALLATALYFSSCSESNTNTEEANVAVETNAKADANIAVKDVSTTLEEQKQKTMDSLKELYTHVKATFSGYQMGDLQHIRFATSDNRLIGFEENYSKYSFGVLHTDEEVARTEEYYGPNKELLGKTFDIFYKNEMNTQYEGYNMNIIVDMFMTDDPIRIVSMRDIMLADFPEYKRILIGDDDNAVHQSVIQHKDGTFSKTMTIKEAFKALKSDEKLYLNAFALKLYETLELKDLENIEIIGDDTFFKAKEDIPIITFKNMKNVSIQNIRVAHEIGENCSQNCLEFYDTDGLKIRNCEFDGSGYFGLALSTTDNAYIDSSEFFNCTYGLAAWNSSNLTVKNNVFRKNRQLDLMVNDSAQFANEFKYENTFQVELKEYTCYIVKGEKEPALWIGTGKRRGGGKVKYNGQEEVIDLIFEKEDYICNDCSYPTTHTYYTELNKGEITGKYKLTKSGNSYDVVYTRKKDGKMIPYTVDHHTKFLSSSPCF